MSIAKDLNLPEGIAVRDLSEITDQRTGVLAHYWAEDAANQPYPGWLVRGLIPSGGLAVVYGAPKSGKSTLAVDVGMRVSLGLPLMDRPSKSGLVLHVAGEDAYGINARVTAWRQGTPADRPPYVIVPGPFDLARSGDVDKLVETISQAREKRGQPAALVIIDTLAACARIEENSAAEVNEVMAECRRIAQETGAAVMIVHHTGKDQEKGMRGSSALLGAVDAVLRVKQHKASRVVDVEAMRNGPSGDGWDFKLRPVEVWKDQADGSPVTACYVEHLPRVPDGGRGQARGKRQQELWEALGRARSDGSAAWTAAELRRIARDNLPGARGSSISGAIAGLQRRGDLVAIEGDRWALATDQAAAGQAPVAAPAESPATPTTTAPSTEGGVSP